MLFPLIAVLVLTIWTLTFFIGVETKVNKDDIHEFHFDFIREPNRYYLIGYLVLFVTIIFVYWRW
jgi:hypothetical protein